jgi:hypothetical protein
MSQPTLFDWQPTAPNGEPIGKTLTTRTDSFGVVVTWISTPKPMNATIPATRLARTNDPDTAKTAAENAQHRGPSQRRRVWEALQRLGTATDYELATAAGILRSSAAKRRQELQTLGHVIETPHRRATDTGTMAIVWRCSYSSVYSGR